MERDFWLARWREGQIGFHQARVEPSLQRFWPGLGLSAGAAVFVPLCGKTLDLWFLARRGHPVVGVELAPDAVRAFFDEAGESPRRERTALGEVYEAAGVTLHCGDFFALAPEALAGVRGVYDRAALIALPPAMRARYVAHLRQLLPREAPIELLLITIEYAPDEVEGPPFSVSAEEVHSLYAGAEIALLDEQSAKGLPPKFEGTPVTGRVHHIRFAPGAAARVDRSQRA